MPGTILHRNNQWESAGFLKSYPANVHTDLGKTIGKKLNNVLHSWWMFRIYITLQGRTNESILSINHPFQDHLELRKLVSAASCYDKYCVFFSRVLSLKRIEKHSGQKKNMIFQVHPNVFTTLGLENPFKSINGSYLYIYIYYKL
jgi:hypothetical protein